jgi:hypothetical protein
MTDLEMPRVAARPGRAPGGGKVAAIRPVINL